MNPEREIQRISSDTEPFSALAFKIMTDPFLGSLTFTRVYSGLLTSEYIIIVYVIYQSVFRFTAEFIIIRYKCMLLLLHAYI